jgi:hypothetical protein
MVVRSRGGHELFEPRRLAGGYLLDEAVAVFLVERAAESNQFVERQAEAIDVAAGVGAVVECFRRHVAKRAEHVAAVGQVVLSLRLGQAEVGDPDCAVRVQKQV